MRSGELESFHPTKSSRESLVNGVEAAVVKWTAPVPNHPQSHDATIDSANTNAEREKVGV